MNGHLTFPERFYDFISCQTRGIFLLLELLDFIPSKYGEVFLSDPLFRYGQFPSDLFSDFRSRDLPEYGHTD
jgi:hypothetical protein